ncbi:P2X purinoceptor 1 [Polypterus senegalus]|uniref:P2X purinoceptor 1 n=1 Tax=Polypterus senegalus TaxID=55291 RepID=UPI00196311B7|nr:P2X purinoceptor 1 [Polypterus senegalus]
MGWFSEFFFEYETPRMALLKDRKIGVVCRLIQLGVLVYIIGWVFIYEKGYQSEDGIISSVSVKVKGVTSTNDSDHGFRVWDVADYVFPEQGDDSFLVMTNFISTRQQQGHCPELPGPLTICSSDNDCKYGPLENGIKTGKCVEYNNSAKKTCEIYGWCPVENDSNIPSPALLLEAERFTVFIKNTITFPEFKVTRSNLDESITKSYLANCTYEKDPLCPIFKLGNLIQTAGFDFNEVALKGGAVGIVIKWDCNLDFPEKYCRPTYDVHGLYGGGKQSSASLGYNFRYAKYFMEEKIEKRTLYKVFGIRFDIIVHGKAGKFDIIPTMTAIGSGVGIFGVATVVCDLLLLYIMPHRHFYKNMKFKYTEEQEECEILP